MDAFGAHAEHDPRVDWSLRQGAHSLMDDSEPSLRAAMQASGTDALLREWDLPFTLARVCALDVDAALALYVSRSTRQGEPDCGTNDAFTHYAAHFARALGLRQEIQRRERAWRTAAPERALRLARLVMDRDARIVHMDEDAKAILRDTDGVRIQRGRLDLCAPAAATHLRHLAEYLATAPRMGAGSGLFELPQRRPPGLLRLRVEPGLTPHAGQRTVVVWLERRYLPGDVAGGATPTPGQRAVLRLLHQGLSTAGIAHDLGIGEATVRTHVKRLLELSGTHHRGACIAEARRRGWL